MERTISVRSYRNIWSCLWRWSTLTGPIISIGRTEMCLFISALFVSCLQITKRAVAWVGSNERGPGAGIINRDTVLPSIRRKAFRTCLVPWCLYVDRSWRIKRHKRDWRQDWREREESEGPWKWGKKKCHPIAPRALRAGVLWLRDESGFRANSAASSGSEAFPLFSQCRIIKPLFESKQTLKLINLRTVNR